MLTLRPQHTARRPLPVNYRPGDAHLFSHLLESVIPETRLLTLHDAGISAEGILFQRGRMHPESFAFAANRKSWKRRSVVKFYVVNYLLRQRRRFERDAVWVVDDWSTGYFHWLTDVLPRLFVVKDRLREWVLLLPHDYRDREFVRASLAALPIQGIEYVGPNEVLSCRTLMVPTHTAPSGHYNEPLIREVGDVLGGFYSNGASVSPDDRLYISRRKARTRRIANEDEVVETLRPYGFRVICAEDYSFQDQVRMASRARYLVSNHGAGLTNMLFMKSGMHVLELRGLNDSTNSCYFTLAAALNLNYFYQTCIPIADDPHIADLTVDPGALRTNLETMLASG